MYTYICLKNIYISRSYSYLVSLLYISRIERSKSHVSLLVYRIEGDISVKKVSSLSHKYLFPKNRVRIISLHVKRDTTLKVA